MTSTQRFDSRNEDPAKPLTLNDWTVIVRRRGGRRQQSIGQSLMVAFEMVMLDEFADRLAKMLLAQQHELVQAFGFDR